MPLPDLQNKSGQTTSSESDIRHLAKAAASNVKIFVTRDGNLLKESKSIFETIGVEVVDPAALIIQLHELTTSQSYAPARISGLNLHWKRLVSNDLKSLPFNSFQKYREKQGKLSAKLHSLIVQTEQYKSEILQTGNQIIAIRVLSDSSSSKVLTVPLVRIASSVNRSLDQSLFERFLIADTIDHAVKTSKKLVQFDTHGLSTSMIPKLLEMGFIELNNYFVRFCFSSNYQSRNDILSEIAVLCPESESIFEEMSDNELEQRCSPVVLNSVDQNYFLIPIKKYYAMNLIDRMESAQGLFGGDPKVLLRWSNVYYRTKDKHKMLRHPAQILWYVSVKQEVIAISRLDEVVIDTAKELFRKFRKFGTLEWRDICEMCKGDSSKELMALKFSHTFTFRKAISLKELRAIYKEHNTAPVLQGPSRISQPIFQEILQKGYPNN